VRIFCNSAAAGSRTSVFGAEERGDLALAAPPGGPTECLPSEQSVQTSQLRLTREGVAVQADGRNVSPRDRTRQRALKGDFASGFERAGRQSRESDAALLLVESGLRPEPGCEGKERCGTTGRERRRRVVERLAVGREPPRAGADSPAEAEAGSRGRLFAFHGHEGAGPALLRSTAESAQRMKRSESCARLREWRERLASERAGEVKREPAGEVSREPLSHGRDRVVRDRQDGDIAGEQRAAIERSDLRTVETPSERPGRGNLPRDQNDRASGASPRSREGAPGAAGADEDDSRSGEFFCQGGESTLG
jgi:hypothetical protein